MKFKGIVAIAAVLLFISCKKKDVVEAIPPIENYTVSGIVTTPGGDPIPGIVVSFDYGATFKEYTTDSSGEYVFEQSGNGEGDLIFNGKPLRYLNMRDPQVNFGGSNRSFDKMMVPWEIEEIDFLSASFVDSLEKKYSLVKYNFDELNMQPGDFENLMNSTHLENFETTFTSAQTEEETEISVSFYSMPKNSGYTIDNHDQVSYADVSSWEKILTITTTTTAVGVLEPVKVNLAAAYANFPGYDHSGTIVMVSDEINETLGVTYDIDLLEIRLPYGDDFVPQ